jgi:hypothetical protein
MNLETIFVILENISSFLRRIISFQYIPRKIKLQDHGLEGDLFLLRV